MRWPRLTTRRIMGLILLLAVVLALAIPAVRVAADRDDHAHSWPVEVAGFRTPGWAGGEVSIRAQFTLTAGAPARSPFWPRYWRCLAGRPWRQVPLCVLDGDQPGETCAYERREPITAVIPAVVAPTRREL